MTGGATPEPTCLDWDDDGWDDEAPCSHCGGSGQCPCEMCWFHPACSYCGGVA